MEEIVTRPYRIRLACLLILLSGFCVTVSWGEERARVRELGIEIGHYPPGEWNAITDVTGVKVGHVTLYEGKGRHAVRTGVTAILPNDDVWQQNVFAATYTQNGNGEMTGSAWVDEAGTLESPILLTGTLNVGRVHDGVVQYLIERYPEDHVALPVVAECYDGGLNDADGRQVTAAHVIQAIRQAKGGTVEEGGVGAGTGMIAYRFKGGIGTASRLLPAEEGAYTVGVLVNANCGRRENLRIDGVPVGKQITDLMPEWHRDGSIIVVVATDAPLLSRQLRWVAKRAMFGVARTGTFSRQSSGDFVIAFSTAQTVPRDSDALTLQVEMLRNDRLNPIYQAVVEATEEAIINALTSAQTTVGRNGNTVYAIPLDRLQILMKQYGRLAERGSP